MAATTGIDQLSDEETARVLALPKVEVALPKSRAAVRAARIAANRQNVLNPASRGQPGPAPSDWSAVVAREDGPTATYLLRYGKTNVWKIGISKNPSKRVDALNFSIPYEFTKARWEFVYSHVWPDGSSAYDMEQTLFSTLAHYRTKCERVLCGEKIIHRAWTDYLSVAAQQPQSTQPH
jgi:hypothetical protein